MDWLILVLAGLLETAWAAGLKFNGGPLVMAGVFLVMMLSVGLLGFALKTLPLSTAYPVWTAIGTVGSFIVGVMMFGEELSFVRVASLLLIVAGIVGLKS